MSEYLAQTTNPPGAEAVSEEQSDLRDDAGEVVPVQQLPVQQPVIAECPELELLANLEEHGAKFDSVKDALAVMSDWALRHGFNNEQHDRQALERRIVLADAFKAVTTGATPTQAFQRFCCLAFELKLSNCRTAAELARRLKITEQRVSQIRAEFKDALSETIANIS